MRRRSETAGARPPILFGLRPRLLAAFVIVAIVSLGAAAVTLLAPLKSRLRDDAISVQKSFVAGAKPTFGHIPLSGGQLDGGHIVYALFENRHKWVTRAVIVALLVLGIFWYGWLLWAVLLFFFARRHPQIYDLSEIGNVRWQMAVLGLILLLLCFTIAPVTEAG